LMTGVARVIVVGRQGSIHADDLLDVAADVRPVLHDVVGDDDVYHVGERGRRVPAVAGTGFPLAAILSAANVDVRRVALEGWITVVGEDAYAVVLPPLRAPEVDLVADFAKIVVGRRSLALLGFLVCRRSLALLELRLIGFAVPDHEQRRGDNGRELGLDRELVVPTLRGIDDDGRTRVAIAQGVRIRRLPDRGAADQGSSGQVGVEPGRGNPEVDLQRSRIAHQSLRYEQRAQVESRYESEVVALTPGCVS